MAKRRGDGEGSIYETKDGRWRAEVSLGFSAAGKPKRKVIYGKTRAEVSASLKKTLRDQQLGINVKPERQTVEAFLLSWLEGTVKPKNRPQTHRSYEWIVKTHIAPSLGKLTLEKLGPQRIQEFLAERLASGLSAGTVKHIRATLRAALSHAHRWGLVHQNAAKLVVVPQGTRYKPTVLTPEQARSFLTIASFIGRGHSLSRQSQWGSAAARSLVCDGATSTWREAASGSPIHWKGSKGWAYSFASPRARGPSVSFGYRR